MEISLKPLSRFRGPLLWDRIGQFDAACPAGHATASAALQRLNRVQASNRFYAATRELGRALKTEFVLQYMSEPQLRATVRRGLLKVEQLHALARAVYYGQAREISRIAAAPASRSTPTCCVMSARSSGRTSSSTARSRSTPPSSRGASLRVYFNTNLVGTLYSWPPVAMACRTRMGCLRVRDRPQECQEVLEVLVCRHLARRHLRRTDAQGPRIRVLSRRSTETAKRM